MSETTRGYRNLIAWQRAMDLIPLVYELTKGFPRDERFVLTSQVQRAVISIAANVAEGQARKYPAEFSQHLAIARGSLAELDTLLLTANRLGYLNGEQMKLIEPRLIEIRKLLQGLIRRLQPL